MKFLNFFLHLWVLIVLLDPDPDPAHQNQCGSGSETLFKTVSQDEESSRKNYKNNVTCNLIKASKNIVHVF
jgi:hypothetical protein